MASASAAFAPEDAAIAAMGQATFESVYAEHFAFVWRSVTHLGVPSRRVDDVVQEIFLVVHRRLAQFAARSTIKTWLFGIVLNCVRAERRSIRRRPGDDERNWHAEPDELVDGDADGPYEKTAKGEALATLHAILDQLDDDKREVFILSELDQMSAPEIAEATGVNVNTVYTRLRAAEREFDRAAERHRKQDERRLP